MSEIRVAPVAGDNKVISFYVTQALAEVAYRIAAIAILSKI
jgi:hypothetical protein